jgi:hypothetical protein
MSTTRLSIPLKLTIVAFLLAVLAVPGVLGAQVTRIGFTTPLHVLDSQITRDAVQTSDGNYVLAGTAFVPDGPGQAVLVKAAPYGAVWVRTFKAEFSRGFYAVAELADGNLVAGGTAFTSIYAGDQDLWFVGLDAEGTPLWEKTFGLPNEQNDVYAMTHTSDGGFIATGLRLRQQGSLSTPATWVLKFDAAGNLQWDRTFTGGSARAIVEASDGTYVLSGGKAIPGSLESFVWAIKIDASGQKLWERAYHQRVFLLLESGLAEAPDGGYLISGRDFVQKVDADGFLVWSQPYRYLIFHSLAILQDGRIAAAGRDIATGSEHAFVAVLAPDGKPLWTNSELLAPSGFAKVLPLAYERTTGVAVAGWVPTCTDGLSFDLLLGTLWEY